MTEEQRKLLEWLAEEKYSQFGECHGRNLDYLVSNGYAVVHDEGEHQDGFAAQGAGMMYRAVSVTEAGRRYLKQWDDDSQYGPDWDMPL